MYAANTTIIITEAALNKREAANSLANDLIQGFMSMGG